MKNISEFQIIGNIGSIEVTDKVAHLDIAANYGRKVQGEWQDDTHWNRVTVFGKALKRVAKMGKGDMVHVRGRVRQNRYERSGETVYTVDLIVAEISVLAKSGKPADDRPDNGED